MTPEQHLLLLGANPHPNPAQIEQLHRLLSSPIDWSVIIAQADKHGISQLLFHTIQEIEGITLPDNAHYQLKQRFDRAIRQNLFLTAELIRVLQLLEQSGITAVPFKGPVLAEQLYGNLALRVFLDLDILIHPEDKEQVKELLLKDGFKYHFHPDSASQFVKSQPPIILEIHWEAISFGSNWLRKLKNKSLPTTLAHLTPRLMTTKLGGKNTTTLSPEDMLLILTIHGSKHWWSRLNWLSDIAALLHVYPTIEWDWVIDQVNYWKIRRLVYLGLNLIHQFLGVKLPNLILDQVRIEPEIEKLTRQVESMFFIEQNFYTRYIKRPAYFRKLWDMEHDRRTLYVDHLTLYIELFGNLFKKQPANRK